MKNILLILTVIIMVGCMDRKTANEYSEEYLHRNYYH
jgi:hypothetical protein